MPSLKSIGAFFVSLPAKLLVDLAFVGVIAFCAILLCNERDRADTAEVETERTKIAAANVALEENASRADLLRKLSLAESNEKMLAAEVKRLLAAAPGGHVTAVESGSTGWISTGGSSPAPAPATPPVAAVTPPTAPLEHGGTPPAAMGGRACWFFEGDEGKIDTERVEGTFEHGTVGVIGVARASGRRPGDEASARVLFAAPLKLSIAKLPGPAERRPRWGLDLGLALRSAGGLEGELGLAAPPARFLWDRLQFEPRVGLACSLGSKLCETWAIETGATIRIVR